MSNISRNIFKNENKEGYLYESVGEFFDTRSNRQSNLGRRKKDRCKKMWEEKQKDPYGVCSNRVAKIISKNKHKENKAEKKSWVKNMCKVD